MHHNLNSLIHGILSLNMYIPPQVFIDFC